MKIIIPDIGENAKTTVSEEMSRCVAKISWDELISRMTDAGVAPVPLAMVRHFEASRLKFYGYGSRFRTQDGSDANENSDWDMLVECEDEDWERLQNGLGFWYHKWTCGRWKGDTAPEQPVFCNYPHEQTKIRGKSVGKHKHSVSVRKITDPESDIFRKDKGEWTNPPTASEYTEIV